MPLELIRFLQVAQTITVHHGALAYLLGLIILVIIRVMIALQDCLCYIDGPSEGGPR